MLFIDVLVTRKAMRKLHNKTCLAMLRGNIDLPFVFLDNNVVRNTQAKPCSLTGWFGVEEWVKQMGHVLLRDTMSIILNFHIDPIIIKTRL